MKYSIQPIVFKEPLKDFLGVFGNLDFLGFNNFTKFGSYRQDFMDLNWNPRIFGCQYSDPYFNFDTGCELFHLSLTNRGIGYTFNQADFFDQYISNWYTKEFSKIFKPKGIKYFDKHPDGKHKSRNSKSNIFYPVMSGPKYGLTVTNN